MFYPSEALIFSASYDLSCINERLSFLLTTKLISQTAQVYPGSVKAHSHDPGILVFAHAFIELVHHLKRI